MLRYGGRGARRCRWWQQQQWWWQWWYWVRGVFGCWGTCAGAYGGRSGGRWWRRWGWWWYALGVIADESPRPICLTPTVHRFKLHSGRTRSGRPMSFFVVFFCCYLLYFQFVDHCCTYFSLVHHTDLHQLNTSSFFHYYGGFIFNLFYYYFYYYFLSFRLPILLFCFFFFCSYRKVTSKT